MQLERIFKKVFNNESLVVNPLMSSKDIKMWDSITHMELIAEVEAEFKIRFSFGEVMQFNTIDDMMKVIEKKVSNSK